MNRDEWKFAYTADKLLEATKTKIAWHSGRLAVWQKAQDETKEKIKSGGMEIDEGVNISEPSYSNSRRGPSVHINNELMEHLNESTQKVVEHREKVRQYEAWEQVLASQGAASFDLNQDDWLFFFGK